MEEIIGFRNMQEKFEKQYVHNLVIYTLLCLGNGHSQLEKTRKIKEKCV